jgi:hypothetical protein
MEAVDHAIRRAAQVDFQRIGTGNRLVKAIMLFRVCVRRPGER